MTKPDLMAELAGRFGFTISDEVPRVLTWPEGGCRVATDEEADLWDATRTHHAELEAAVRDAETLRRVKAMRDEWERDEREHLATFGQHLPASVICMVEKLDRAMRAGEGEG